VGRKPAIIQSRAVDETGYVQPTYKQLRAVRGTPVDLSQQRNPVMAGSRKREVKNVQLS
jgi:sulfane dehydrogenase subunit SoxC